MTTRLLPAGNFPHLAGTWIGRPSAGLPGQVPSVADDALVQLYDGHSRSLLGLAAVLVWGAARPTAPLITGATAPGGSLLEYLHSASRQPGEPSTTGEAMAPGAAPGIAEDIVSDAFTAMRRDWRRLRDAERAVAFLRRSVVHSTRCLGSLPESSPGGAATAPGGRMLAALRWLPGRQREALVLRYYADLPEAQAAAAMGVTRAALRWHVARGMAALRLLLDED